MILKEKSGQIIGLMNRNGKHNKVLIKLASEYLGILQRNLASKSFVYLGDSQEHKGFIEYKQYNVPKNYQIHYTTARALWKNWWPRQHFEQGSQIQLNLLILLGEQWYPIKNILVESGKIYIKTLVKEIILDSEDKLVWINKITEKEFLRSNSHLPVPQINSVAENHLGSENQDQQKNVQNNSLSATQKKDILLRLENLESKLNDLTFNYQQKMTALQNEYLEEVKALRQQMSSLSQSLQQIDLPPVKETTVVKSMGEVPKSILNLVVSASPSEDKKFDLKAWLRNSTKPS